MRLLLVHQAFAAPRNAGGTRHYEFASRVVERGHECVVITGSRSYLSGETDQGQKIEPGPVKDNALRIVQAYVPSTVHTGKMGRGLALVIFSITSFIRAIRLEKPDIFMSTSPPLFQGISTWLVSFLRRRPFLLEIRDIWPDFLIDMGILRNKALIRVFRILEKFLYNRAILIIVNSPAYAPILVEKGVPEDKIELVSNGVEIRMFDPMATGEAFREEQGLKGKFLGVYAGALGKANDIWTILEAAQVLRDNQRIRLVLVGDGMERKELEMAAKQRGLDNLIFTGAQPKMKIPEILAASDLCMATLMDIPMFRTTFPNKVFDYMAAGRPIALAIDGVIREVVEKADCGLCVPPGDGRALAEAMEWMEQNHESAKRMGLAGRAYVAEHYDREKLAKKLIHIIESIH